MALEYAPCTSSRSVVLLLLAAEVPVGKPTRSRQVVLVISEDRDVLDEDVGVAEDDSENVVNEATSK